jgi:hypothetical protein
MICGYEFPSGVVCGQAHGHQPPHIPWGRGADVRYHQQWINEYERRADVHRASIAHILETATTDDAGSGANDDAPERPIGAVETQ